MTDVDPTFSDKVAEATMAMLKKLKCAPIILTGKHYHIWLEPEGPDAHQLYGEFDNAVKMILGSDLYQAADTAARTDDVLLAILGLLDHPDLVRGAVAYAIIKAHTSLQQRLVFFLSNKPSSKKQLRLTREMREANIIADIEKADPLMIREAIIEGAAQGLDGYSKAEQRTIFKYLEDIALYGKNA
jgi:hypothetical protein